eukprot:3697025-Heterocapsa_arctica.AAC.1
MGMPWQAIMNPRHCPQNPFGKRNKGVGPDLAIGIPLTEPLHDPQNEDPQDTVPTEEKDDYCPWAVIDAFTKTMWE